MSIDRFSIKEALQFGWETTKGNFLFFFLVLLIALFIGILPDLAGFFLGIDDPTRLPLVMAIIVLVVFIAWYALSLTMQLGLARIALRFCDGEKGKYSDLFTSFPLVLRYFIASILFFFIVLGGLILLIIPGAIWAIQFGFFLYVIVDRGAGIVESLKESSRITKGSRQKIFLFILALIGINILGAIPLGLGLLVTVPTSMLAHAFVYRRLSGKLDTSHIPIATEGPVAATPIKTVHKPKRKEEAPRRPLSPGEEWRNRGLFCLHRDDFEGAVEAFTKAIELDPRFGAAYHSRGFAHYRLGEYQQAKNDFDQAIELDKNYAEDSGAYMYRGLSLERLGNRQQAIEDMELAVNLGNKGADKWLAWLTEGKEPQ